MTATLDTSHRPHRHPEPPERDGPADKRPGDAPGLDPAAGNNDRPLLTYRFRAIDRDGELNTGEMVARSDTEIIARLRRRGMRPVTVTVKRRSALSAELTIPGFGPKVSRDEMAVFARQFATMVGAGVPLLRGLTVLTEQSGNELLTSTLNKVRADIESGDSLSESIARHPRVFEPLVVSMIRAGETAGALDVVLLQLANGLEKTASTRRKIKSALTYPTAVLGMVVLIMAAMMVFVVPVFAGIYEDLGSDLPLPTQALVSASDVITTRLPIATAAFAFAVFVARRWVRSPAGRLRWDGWLLKMPLVGPLVHKSAMARFGRTMAVLTKSGVPVLDTLHIAGENVGNAVISNAVADIRGAVTRGEDLASNMARYDVFPPMVSQLVAVGEETGSLDEMLEIVGTTYEEEVEASVAGFSALIEPLLMATIGVTVGSMVVALYLPMFRIIDLVQ